MNKPKVKLEDIVAALELPEETQAYLNKVTGEVSWFTDQILSAARDEDLVIEDYPEWERGPIQEAKRLLDSDDFLALPSRFDLHEFRIMERFCQSIEDEKIRHELLDAIRGSGAFRRFRNKVRRYGIANQWYEFRRRTIEGFAIQWLQENGFEWQQGGQEVPETDSNEPPSSQFPRSRARGRVLFLERLNRRQLLAAEVFSYSYAHYADHLDKPRFHSVMPKIVDILERAVEQRWPIEKLAKKLEVNREEAEGYLESYHRALEVVDAENPAEAFRNGVRQSIQFAIEKGLSDDEAVEDLVTQICYRAADLAYLLNLEGSELSRYSRHLRHEPDVGYYDGYFDDEERAR